MPRLDPGVLRERILRLRELLDKDPDDAMVWFGLGQSLMAIGRPSDAVEPLENATRIDPFYTAAFRELGRAHLESGNPSEAARVFAHAIGLAERTGDLQTGREIHVFLKRVEKARDPEAGSG